MAAVGCGAPYAKGALTALYHQFNDPEKLTKRVLEIAAIHSAGVDGPFLSLVN
jgi:ATP-dependent protease HslVU (ClpYQ) peptidase subunit